MSWLSRRFGRTITVAATTDALHIQCGERALFLPAVLFVANGIVVGVGTPPPTVAEPLAVFCPDPTDRAQRVAKLVAFGLHAIVGRVFIRPNVLLSASGGASFSELEAALLAAGAGTVLAVRPVST